MKRGLQRIFSEVSTTYELINHVLTFGLDILWRRKAAREAVRVDGAFYLDVCTGTGETAQYLSRFGSEGVRVVALDFCFPMLEQAMKKPLHLRLFPVLAEANSLPFPDECFDLITISFATRNINPTREMLIKNLREFWRVLKLGGRFINLETSQPSIGIIRTLFHFYVKLFVKPVGHLMSGSKTGYTYLSRTILRFYSAEEFSLLPNEVGFQHTTSRPLLFGIAAIHSAKK